MGRLAGLLQSIELGFGGALELVNTRSLSTLKQAVEISIGHAQALRAQSQIDRNIRSVRCALVQRAIADFWDNARRLLFRCIGEAQDDQSRQPLRLPSRPQR